MGLDQSTVIDAIGTSRSGEEVVLTIFDSWEWGNDDRKHLSALQDKLNSYFEFIEAGNVFSEYPSAEGKRLRIDVVSRYPLSPSGAMLLQKAEQAAAALEVAVTQREYRGSSA